MKYILITTACAMLTPACSSEVAPIPGDDDHPLTWPAWTEDGGGSVSLRDAGTEPSALDGSDPDPTRDASTVVEDAGDGADVTVPETQTDAGPDSGTAEMLLHNLFVGVWSLQKVDAGHPCDEAVTLDTIQCPTALSCSSQEISIDETYAMDPAWVDFVRWEDGNVWFGERVPNFADQPHDTLRLWFVGEDTILGSYKTELPSRTICTPWKLTRQ